MPPQPESAPVGASSKDLTRALLNVRKELLAILQMLEE